MAADNTPAEEMEVAAEDAAEKVSTEKASTEKLGPENTASKESDIAEKPVDPEYNPLVVRRSQRAIKPTKDIDLYLLGAKYGVDVEGSDADSSDLEFAPEAVSDGECDEIHV